MLWWSEQVLPSIANAHPAVRNMAVVCLGTCTLHSKEVARTHLVLLLQVSNTHPSGPSWFCPSSQQGLGHLQQ